MDRQGLSPEWMTGIVVITKLQLTLGSKIQGTITNWDKNLSKNSLKLMRVGHSRRVIFQIIIETMSSNAAETSQGPKRKL